MLNSIKKKWSENGFEITLGLCIAFILLFGLYYKLRGKKGTWTKKHHIDYPKFEIGKNKYYQRPPSESKGETECRRVLQYLFKRKFDKARPDFLRNPVTGGNFNLELDCFDGELRIAVEYNGIQHYQYIPFFHKNKEAFLNQKYRDDMKRRICRDNGILLIEVPHTVKLEDIKGFIESALTRNGIKF